MNNILSIGSAFVVIVLLLPIIIKAIRQHKSWFLVGFFSLALNSAIWSICLVYFGLTPGMAYWQVGYTILFIISLVGLLYENQTGD